jgi:N-acetylneuraminate synthase
VLRDDKFISIAGRKIGSGYDPYVIAEISANHNGSLSRAYQLLDSAKENGADAVKLQTYTPDTITLDAKTDDFLIKKGLWAGKTLYQLYLEAHTPWEWHQDLFDYAKSIGITIFSSPFDNSAVDFLEDLGAPAYKIASFELVDTNLIRYVAGTGKPLIMSTGMANEREISDAVDAALMGGAKEIALLHCVSGYPVPIGEYNLRAILRLLDDFPQINTVGLSDHTLTNVAAQIAVGLGASIIEKHYTLDRNGGGPDDSFSMEPLDLKNLVSELKNVWHALGSPKYQIKPSELDNIKFRRSLYFVKSIKKGESISVGDIRSVRPGYGLPPRNFDALIGRRLSRDVVQNSPVTWEDLLDADEDVKNN